MDHGFQSVTWYDWGLTAVQSRLTAIITMTQLTRRQYCVAAWSLKLISLPDGYLLVIKLVKTPAETEAHTKTDSGLTCDEDVRKIGEAKYGRERRVRWGGELSREVTCCYSTTTRTWTPWFCFSLIPKHMHGYIHTVANTHTLTHSLTHTHL